MLSLPDARCDAAPFGQLRSVLHQPPSAPRWRELCALLDDWPNPRARDEELLPYIEHGLQRWASAHRVAPVAWTARVGRGESMRMWRLVRAVTLWRELDLTHEALEHLGRPEHFAHISHLTLHDRDNLGVTSLNRLMRDAKLSHLHSLAIHDWSASPDRLAIALAEHPFTSLRRLRLTRARLDARALSLLLRAPWLHKLDTLDLRQNLLTDHAVELLLHADLGALIHLDLAKNRIGHRGLRALLHTPQLKLLVLSDNLTPLRL